ncbi:MAG: hypothetical protein AAFV59_02090 [Pseudomonadota bacterium]
MRFIFTLICLFLVGGAGWIFGSFYPAPAIILDPIQNLIQSRDEFDPTPLSEPDGTVADKVDAAASEPEPIAGQEILPESNSALSKEDALARYRLWISEARAVHPYPETEQRMYDVMMCESGGNATIVNPAGPYNGLFQYVAGTWAGDWNAYRDADIFDARAQIFATALAWNKGMQSHWGCYAREH